MPAIQVKIETLKVNKKNFIRYLNVLFWSYLALGVVVHLLFYLFTANYLITSGIIFNLIFLILVYLLILSIKLLFHLKFSTANLKLTFASLAVCLTIIESILLCTGYKSTFLEKRFKNYYESPFKVKNNSWYHVWTKNHFLSAGEYSFFRSVNSLGLSDKEHPLEKNENEYRIIGLGDSFTEGDGTHMDSTWLKFLEKKLKAQNLNKDVRFINAGVCGSDPFYEYKLLNDKLLAYNPDMVILCLNSTDIFDVFYRGGMERFKEDGTVVYSKPPSFEPLFAISRISRLFIQKILHYNEMLIKKHSNSIELAEEKIFQLLLLFQNLSITKNFKLLIVFNPLDAEVINGYTPMYNIIARLQNQTNIPHVDLLEYFIKNTQINKNNYTCYYWKNDGHHNAKGYELFAEGICWKLNELRIIELLKK